MRSQDYPARPNNRPYRRKNRAWAIVQSAGKFFDSMNGLFQRYHLQGDDCFITTVDSALLLDWLGTEQFRYCEINADPSSVVGLFAEHPTYPGRRFRAMLTGRKECPRIR